MANIGHVEVEVRPTVTFESAVACVYMLNLFLDGNDDYMLSVMESGRVSLVEKTSMRGAIHCDKVDGWFGVTTTPLGKTDKGAK